MGQDGPWRSSPRGGQAMKVAFGAAGAIAALAVMSSALAADIGQVKVVKGQVTLERAGQVLPVAVGTRVQQGDVVKTGADASVGITMTDDTLLSAGPHSVLALTRYEYDATKGAGRFDSSLSAGSLAVVSGRVAKQSPEAMTVRT